MYAMKLVAIAMCTQVVNSFRLMSTQSESGFEESGNISRETCEFEALKKTSCELPEKAFTYDGRPYSSYRGRWASIESELTKVRTHDGAFSVVDVGSNFGYFSLQTAMHLPKSFVFGIEGSVGAGNGHLGNSGQEHIQESAGVLNHMKWIGALSLNNCKIATEVWDYDRIADLRARGFFADVMLLLSVFHHIDNASRDQYKRHGFTPQINGTVNLMANMLGLASMHIIELPNLGNGMKTGNPMRMPHLYKEYGSVEAFLREVIQRSSMQKVLRGPIYKDNVHWLDDQGTRPVYVIQDAQHALKQGLPTQKLESYFDHLAVGKQESN